MMKQAQVIYYLCRGGALEHPHLIDVGYSEEHGLLLRDVKRRLVAIRGKGLPDLFSWSYKTRYRNDFIWHDVSDNDVISPMSDAEYVLKGSEIVEGESLMHHCDAEIQCKTMLKDHCCLTRSPLHRFEAAATAGAMEECIIRTTNHSAEMKKTTCLEQTKSEPGESGHFPRPVSPFQQCRGEKPLPCVHRKAELIIPIPRVTEKTPPRRCMSSVPAPMFGENAVSSKEDFNSSKSSKKTSSSSSLIFRQMLPCADIGTKAQQGNGLFQGQKQIFAGRESNGTSWKPKAPKKGGKLVSLSADNGTNLSEGRHSHDIKSSLDFVHGCSTPGGKNNKFQDEFQQRYSSTLTRYKPRHSFTNNDYYDSYDLYWRAEKVKEMDNELGMPRQSNASRISLESQFYEVDCKSKSTLDTGDQKDASVFIKLNQKHFEESPRASVSSQIISKLVLDAKANEERNNNAAKPAWWEEARAPGKETGDHERLRKNKLDWEKNLQDAVDMIIRPSHKVLHC